MLEDGGLAALTGAEQKHLYGLREVKAGCEIPG
jgi:hypothetical protein